jgi:hypothetical protein
MQDRIYNSMKQFVFELASAKDVDPNWVIAKAKEIVDKIYEEEDNEYEVDDA